MKNRPDDSWNEFLLKYHRQWPSRTPATFAFFKTERGQTSYEMLASSIDPLRNSSATVLDLACGDGFLIPLLLSKLGSSAKVVGVDMSGGELEVAREKFKTTSDVVLYQARAQSLPLPDSSVEAVVCHMAFMLMLPLEPVVNEILRVLKSRGTFSAVIGTMRGQSGFLGDIQKFMVNFIDARYPQLRQMQSGDRRVYSEEGLLEIFGDRVDHPIHIFDFSLLMDANPDCVWGLMKDTYFVAMMSESDKDQLEIELKNFVLLKLETLRMSSFEFPMRMFTLRKI